MTDQKSLFALDESPAARDEGPAGLRYEPDFICPAEEAELLSHIRTIEVQPFQFGAFEGKRRVAWFGWQYDYAVRKLTKAGDIPSWLHSLIARIEAFDRLAPGSIRQVLTTEYESGAGIGWHRDKPHFDRIYGLSLLTSCRFRFRRKRAGKWERYAFQAEPRSLYRIDGAARHEWEHSISGVEQLRYSVTFRSMAA